MNRRPKIKIVVRISLWGEGLRIGSKEGVSHSSSKVLSYFVTEYMFVIKSLKN